MGFGNIVYWIEMNETFHMRRPQYSMNILIWPIGAKTKARKEKKKNIIHACTNTHEVSQKQQLIYMHFWGNSASIII